MLKRNAVTALLAVCAFALASERMAYAQESLFADLIEDLASTLPIEVTCAAYFSITAESLYHEGEVERAAQYDHARHVLLQRANVGSNPATTLAEVLLMEEALVGAMTYDPSLWATLTARYSEECVQINKNTKVHIYYYL